MSAPKGTQTPIYAIQFPNAIPCPLSPLTSTMSILTQLPLIPSREPPNPLRPFNDIPPLLAVPLLNRQPPPLAMKLLLLLPPLLLRLPVPLPLQPQPEPLLARRVLLRLRRVPYHARVHGEALRAAREGGREGAAEGAVCEFCRHKKRQCELRIGGGRRERGGG